MPLAACSAIALLASIGEPPPRPTTTAGPKARSAAEPASTASTDGLGPTPSKTTARTPPRRSAPSAVPVTPAATRPGSETTNAVAKPSPRTTSGNDATEPSPKTISGRGRDPQRRGGERRHSPTHVVLSCVYCSSACSERSRPVPEDFMPPNGRGQRARVVGVDPHRPRAQPARDAVGRGDVARPHRRGEPVLRRLGQGDRVLDALRLLHGEHGTEDLLAREGHLGARRRRGRPERGSCRRRPARPALAAGRGAGRRRPGPAR